jgi:hypothetical protein
MSDILKKSKIIDSELRDKDVRGSILSIINTNISNVSIIECNKDSIRSNHYHLSDWHYMYVLSGRINYFFSDINMKNINYLKVMTNQIIFTPSMEIHCTHFPVHTSLIVCSKKKRDQKNYEKDTRRVDFIDKNNLNYYLAKFS